MCANGPTPVAVGRNGRWVKLGEVGVDSGTIAIADPGMPGPQGAPTGRGVFAVPYGAG